MASFWSEVFDLRPERETPGRARASVQLGFVLVVLGLLSILVVGLGPDGLGWLPVLLVLNGCGLALGSWIRLRRLRRLRRERRRAER